MGFLRLFKRRQMSKKQGHDSTEAVKRRLSIHQEGVYKAVKEIGRPVNGLAIAQYMHVDSASVTPRLAELVKKNRLRVHHTKRGLDGIYRRFYVVGDDK